MRRQSGGRAVTRPASYLRALKPCPFCRGGELLAMAVNSEKSIVCQKCLASSGAFASMERAFNAWNHRGAEKYVVESISLSGGTLSSRLFPDRWQAIEFAREEAERRRKWFQPYRGARKGMFGFVYVSESPGSFDDLTPEAVFYFSRLGVTETKPNFEGVAA